jgi:hypothetical protein
VIMQERVADAIEEIARRNPALEKDDDLDG